MPPAVIRSWILDVNKLFEKYREFVFTTGDTMWRYNDPPVLQNLRVCFQAKPPVDSEALAMDCLKQWEQGLRMHQTSRQKLYSFLNRAVQAVRIKPIYSPPSVLPATLKPKRIRYPLSDLQILQLLDNLPESKIHEPLQIAIQLCAV